MREAFEKVKAIIDGWDPVDLLTCCHCPSDEYDDISMELAQMLTFDTKAKYINCFCRHMKRKNLTGQKPF